MDLSEISEMKDEERSNEEEQRHEEEIRAELPHSISEDSPEDDQQQPSASTDRRLHPVYQIIDLDSFDEVKKASVTGGSKAKDAKPSPDDRTKKETNRKLRAQELPAYKDQVRNLYRVFYIVLVLSLLNSHIINFD